MVILNSLVFRYFGFTFQSANLFWCLSVGGTPPFFRKYWQIPHPVIQWGSQAFLFHFLPWTHGTGKCSIFQYNTLIYSNSHKGSTKWPSVLSPGKVQRHASMLGTEIAAVLLHDHAEGQPVHPSTTNKPAVGDPLLAPFQRADPASSMMLRNRMPPLLTHHTQRHGSSQCKVSLSIQAFPGSK